ncbi:MAG: NUDIX domain-containing protein [Halieaceae bacterium]
MREGVIIVLQRGERFLVGQRASHKPAAGYWTQVSGKIEPGESQSETVAREAMEELGCEITALEKLQQLPSNNGKYLLHYWRCEIVAGEPFINNDELDELRWVTTQELRGMSPVFEEDIELFTRLLEGEAEGG